MATYTSVANLALMKIGASDTIVAPDQDSHAARSIKSVWDDVRKACIRGGKRAPRWNFAMAYAELAPRAPTIAKPVAWGWESAYPTPKGFLRLVDVVDPVSASGRWMFAGGEILTRTKGVLRAWVLTDIVSPELWDADFVQTVAARLAFEVCDRVSGDVARKRGCWDEYQANLAAAAHVDALENPPVEAEEDDWIKARWS